MESISLEKQKHSLRRAVPWWLLTVGFVLGVVFTLLAVRMSSQPAVVNTGNSISDDEIWMTATYIIQRATAAAQGIILPPGSAATPAPQMDGILMTATSIVEQATQRAHP